MKEIIITLFLTGVTFGAAASEKSPYISKVYDFLPAPGQFVNELPEYEEGDSKDDILKKVEEQICGAENPGMISLGAYGGYVVFGFDHPVANVKDAYDFKIYGNSFLASGSSSGGSCEPGIVMVSVDTNGNGIADDEWYELAGSEYNKETTTKNYSITYYKPSSDKEADPDPNNKMITDRTYIRYTTNDENKLEGYVMKNSFHQQSYWPEWYDGETIEFTGTKLADNAVDQSGNGSYFVLNYYDWGYADNQPNDVDNGFNIDWAVDAEGNPVELQYVDFIKVYTAVNQYCGWIGETSTEICGAEDLHPDAEITGIDSIENPAHDVKVFLQNNAIVVRSSADGIKVELLSITGCLIDYLTLQSGDNMIDISNMPTGIYLLKTDNRVIKFVR